MLFLFSFFLALFFHRTQAILLNVTIDDTTGDSLTGAHVTYSPTNAWNSSRTCIECPDPKKLFSGTSHTSAFSVNDTKNPNVPSTATVSFSGSAIYVFCAVSHSASSPGNLGGDSDMTFYVDGVQVGVFVQPAVGSAGFDYSVPVFVNSALPPGPHTFTLQNGHENGPSSLLVLDQIIYTRENPSGSGTAAPQSDPSASASAAPQNAHSSTIAVAAVLVCALVFLLLALGLFLYRRRRHRRAVYARYMPEGAVRVFPASRPVTPMSTANSFVVTPRARAAGLAPLPPAYAGGGLGGNGGGNGGNWWAGRDQKTRGGGPTHRPFADLDPASAGLQRPQGWEHSRSRNHSFDSSQF